MSSELEIAWKNAHSFSGKLPPNGASYIGTVNAVNREYLFYKDTSNQYWYKSSNKRIKN